MNSTARPVHRAATRATRSWRVLGLVLFLALYAGDQLTKWWVVATLHEGEAVTVLDGLLWWRFIRNPGAAFSLGESVTWVFTLVMAVVAVVILWWLPRARPWPWILSLFGLLAGVLGNLTDRVLREPGFGRGHVVDFIAVPHFAIFNVADSCICVSIACIALLVLRGVPVEGSPPQEELVGSEASEPDAGNPVAPTSEEPSNEHSTIEDEPKGRA